MILFSVGLPGPFAEWCDAVAARLIETHFGSASLMNAESPEQVAADLIEARAEHLVVWARVPSEPLRALFAGAPLLVSFDDPRRAVYELAAVRGADLCSATRDAAQSCAAAFVCASMPGTVLLHADRHGRDPAASVAAVAQACGLALDADETAALLAQVPFPGDAVGFVPAGPWWESLAAEQHALVEGALGAYRRHFAGEDFGEIVWDRTLLWLAADRGRHAGEAIEIGGTPAELACGPDIGMPPGQWNAALTLGISREAAGFAFDIEIWARSHNERLARASVVPDGRGLGSATVAFDITAPTGQTIGFSIASTGAGAGGRLALGHVVVAPRPNDGSDIPSELATVLGLG